MCSRVERRLGLGFYGHDIMPESGTGKLYLAETGFKFDDLAYSGRMHSIAGSLTFADEFSNAAIERAADALLSEARRTGALPGGHD